MKLKWKSKWIDEKENLTIDKAILNKMTVSFDLKCVRVFFSWNLWVRARFTWKERSIVLFFFWKYRLCVIVLWTEPQPKLTPIWSNCWCWNSEMAGSELAGMILSLRGNYSEFLWIQIKICGKSKWKKKQQSNLIEMFGSRFGFLNRFIINHIFVKILWRRELANFWKRFDSARKFGEMNGGGRTIVMKFRQMYQIECNEWVVSFGAIAKIGN